jgi:hypothetical protein
MHCLFYFHHNIFSKINQTDLRKPFSRIKKERMNSAIQNTISQYVAAFLDKASEKFSVPKEQLEELWKETQKEKHKRSAFRRATTHRAPSAYINFCNHHRKLIKAENPALKFGEVAKALGKLWKELGADEKKRYSDPAYVPTPKASAVEEEGGKKAKRRKNKD